MKIFRRFRTKFIFLTAGAVVLSILAAYFIETKAIIEYIKSDVKEELKKNVTFINQELSKLKNDIWTEGLLTVSQDIKSDGMNVFQDTYRMKWIIKKISDNYMDLEAGVYDVNGVLLEKTKGYSERYADIEMLDEKLHSSDEDLIEPELYILDNKLYIRVLIKIKKEYNTTAILVLNNRISDSYAIEMKETFLGKDTRKYFSGEIVICDKNGEILAASSKATKINRDKIKKKNDDFFYETKKQLLYFRYYPENNIWIGIAYPVNKLKNIIFQKNIFLINIIIAIILSIFIYFVIKRITEPVSTIINGIGEVKRGNLDYKIVYKGEEDLEDAVSIFNGMTESLKANREIEARYSSLDKIASVGRLAAGIAHEIKNPLASMQMISEMYYEEFENIKFKREDFMVMSKEIKRINSILENLLEFAKSEKIEIKYNNILKGTEEIVNLTSKSAKNSQTTIILENKSDNPQIMCDLNMFKQMMLNLIINSMESADGGMININIYDIGEDIIISVTDNGKGMDEVTLKKAMEPFYTTKTKGTGIGLAIVKKIIDLHNFRYELKSDKDIGTEFKIIVERSENMKLSGEQNYLEEEILERRN